MPRTTLSVGLLKSFQESLATRIPVPEARLLFAVSESINSRLGEFIALGSVLSSVLFVAPDWVCPLTLGP